MVSISSGGSSNRIKKPPSSSTSSSGSMNSISKTSSGQTRTNSYNTGNSNNSLRIPNKTSFSTASGNVVGLDTADKRGQGTSGFSDAYKNASTDIANQFGLNDPQFNGTFNGNASGQSIDELINILSESETGLKLLTEAKARNVHIDYVGNNGDSIAGLYDGGSNTITLENQGNLERNIEVLAHELGHAITPENNNSMSEEFGNMLLGEKVAKELGIDNTPHSNGDWQNLVQNFYGRMGLPADNNFFEQMKSMGIDILEGAPNPFEDGYSQPGDGGITGNSPGQPGDYTEMGNGNGNTGGVPGGANIPGSNKIWNQGPGSSVGPSNFGGKNQIMDNIPGGNNIPFGGSNPTGGNYPITGNTSTGGSAPTTKTNGPGTSNFNDLIGNNNDLNPTGSNIQVPQTSGQQNIVETMITMLQMMLQVLMQLISSNDHGLMTQNNFNMTEQSGLKQNNTGNTQQSSLNSSLNETFNTNQHSQQATQGQNSPKDTTQMLQQLLQMMMQLLGMSGQQTQQMNS
jgi:hypothetical protein